MTVPSRKIVQRELILAGRFSRQKRAV
jgi:hypothetical protein